jgi:serine/threonine-protein kinase RsbW
MSDTVTLTIPSDTAYVALARSVAATMSAQADLPIDQLEDVRLAVDEALSQVIADAPPGSDITCTYTVDGADLSIIVAGASVSGEVPSTGTFSWIVMRALVDHVSADVADGALSLHLRVSRTVPVEA